MRMLTEDKAAQVNKVAGMVIEVTESVVRIADMQPTLDKLRAVANEEGESLIQPERAVFDKAIATIESTIKLYNDRARMWTSNSWDHSQSSAR